MERAVQSARRHFGGRLAPKTSQTVYFKWFGVFFGDPFLATIFLPERSHAAWRSFFLAPERSRCSGARFWIVYFFSCSLGWSYVGPVRASKTSIKPMHFYIFCKRCAAAKDRNVQNLLEKSILCAVQMGALWRPLTLIHFFGRRIACSNGAPKNVQKRLK